MPIFPQLSSGALAQYPIAARRIVRTVLNEAADGRHYKYADARLARAEWDIRLAALTSEEWQKIEDLYVASEGRLQTFTFLDPLDNLLRHSEDLAQPVWEPEPLLTLTSGVADPWGTERATRLTNGAAVQSVLKQTVAAPGTYQYCLSAYARASQPVTMRLRLNAGPSFADRFVTLESSWQHFTVFAALDWNDTGVEATFALPAGASADLAGLQLEAQPAPSSYKKTGATSGVYAHARFASDRLLQTTTDVDQHETVIRITATWE
jgi:hypothetical protein